MAYQKLRVLESRFQADLWQQTLEASGVPYLLRTFEDTAYDGLFVSQRGFGDILVEDNWLERARRLDKELSEQLVAPPASLEALAGRLDATLLAPAAGRRELDSFLRDCLRWQVAAACVSPWMVPAAARALETGPVAVCSVVAFPLGTASRQSKLAQASELAQAGADELDLVLNRGLELSAAVAEVSAVAQAVRPVMVKVIIEAAALGPQATAETGRALIGSGAAMVKTGSGYFGPADAAQITNLRQVVGRSLGIKAAGGIKTLAQAMALLEAGADRLGTSAAGTILQQAEEQWGAG